MSLFNKHSISLLAAIGILLAASCLNIHAARQPKIELPDFTQGDPIPEAANHDWNLGATGARGWMYSDRLVTRDARQVKITRIEAGSPADGKGARIPQCLGAIESYGVAAKPLLPRLKELEKDLTAHPEAIKLQPHIDRVQKLISQLEKTTGKVELKTID